MDDFIYLFVHLFIFREGNHKKMKVEGESSLWAKDKQDRGKWKDGERERNRQREGEKEGSRMTFLVPFVYLSSLHVFIFLKV